MQLYGPVPPTGAAVHVTGVPAGTGNTRSVESPVTLSAIGAPTAYVACRSKREHGLIVRCVFCYTDGKKAGQRITESGFNQHWRKARLAAGCPGRIPHDFRRTAVRNLVRAGVPERVAMQLTGHKTRAVFERYNITSPADLWEAAQRLDAFAAATG